MTTLPFDRVIVTVDGQRRAYTAEQFLALPLYERIGYILGKEARFELEGQPVERSSALRALRDAVRGAG